MAVLTRRELSRLANAKVADARLLLRNERWATSYYLYGAAIELAIKAAIARQIPAETIQERAFSNTFYSHDLTKLVALAGLAEALAMQLGDARFKAAWEIIASWTNDSRYEDVDEGRARAIADAVDKKGAGVFRWLKTHW